MFKNKIKNITLALVLLMQVVPQAFAGFINIQAYGADTVAGYASLLKSSLIEPAKEVTFVVEKPDYSVVRVPAQADLEGIATADLYGHQTKLAGEYKVAIHYPGTLDVSPQSSFTVYPDQVSESQSLITSTTQHLQADGAAKTFVTVSLFDAYRNPIKDHQVKLISSRPEDKVEVLQGGITDDEGRANFKLTSKKVGVSVLTAVDASANTIINDREEIVFTEPEVSGIGGNFFSSGLLQAQLLTDDPLESEVLPGPVSSFEIQGLSSNEKVNTDLTMTIVAKDNNGNVAKNYTGTILISTPDDENAVLPNNGEYTFKEADQGEFTFNLALRFTQLGNQYIQVLDKNDWKISGEKQVEIVPEQTVSVPTGSTSGLSIKSPVNGAEFGSNLIVITGQGDPNINLKVFNDDIKIGDTETDSDGFFSYQASSLASGGHSFYVMSENGQVSPSVFVTVDTFPPVLANLTVQPDGLVEAGQSLKITVNSEPNLDEVKIRLQGIEKTLSPDPGIPGSYSITMVSPAASGSYPLDVVLVDELSNRSELLNQKSVLVESKALLLPGQVEGLQGVVGEGQVILNWNPLVGHTTSIAKYKVNYGTDLESLNQMIETTGPQTLLTIPNLINDTQYFFSVKAVDAQGLESATSSVTIGVTPVKAEEEETEEESGLFESAEEQGGSTENTGSGSQPSGLPAASLYGNPLSGTSSSNTASLTWQAFPGVNAANYKVYFGLASGQYDDFTFTKGPQTSFVVQDLISGVPYYFAVVALDNAGNEISPLSAELNVTPGGAGFQSLPSEQVIPSNPTYVSPLSNFQLSKVPSQEATGSASIWVIVFSVTMAGALYNYKRRVING